MAHLHNRVIGLLGVLATVASLLAVAPARPAEAAPITQYRALDTRDGAKPGDGAIRCVTVATEQQMQAGLEAVGINLTAARATGQGFLTAYPAGIGPPGTSTLNYNPAQGNIANNAVVEVGVNGNICVSVSVSTDVVIDINHVFYDDAYRGVRPFRARDTRNEEKPGAGSTTCTRVAGVGGIPSNASSVALNVAAVRVESRGYLAIFPKGTDRPSTSNLNYLAGENISNGSIVGVGDDGEICVFSSEVTDHVIDVTGSFVAYQDVSTLSPPRRLYDSRSTTRRGAGRTGCLKVVGNGVPFTATSVFLNVTTVRPSDDGYVTTFPAGQPLPIVSSLNYRAGGFRANGVMVPVGAGGRVCFFTFTETDLVVDLLAYEVFGPEGNTVPGPTADVGRILLRQDSGRLGACPAGYFRLDSEGPVDWRNWINKWEFSSTISLSALNQRTFFQIEAYHSIMVREVCFEARYVYEFVGRPDAHLERCAAYTTALRLPPVDMWAFNWANSGWQQVSGNSNPCPNNGSGNLTSDPQADLDGTPDSLASTAGDPGTPATLRRLAGDGRQQTAVAIADHAFPTGARTVYVAEEGAGLAEALAAGTITDGPVLLADGDGVPSLVVLQGLADLVPDRVVALGSGESGIIDAVLEELAQGRPTDRIGGSDVFVTSANIAREAWPTGAATVYLAEAERLADGLAGGTITDGPILLVPSDGSLPTATADVIAELDPGSVVALGGSGAIADGILSQASDGRSSGRIDGASRYETAAAIAQAVFPDTAETVYLARADIAPDAVVAGSVDDGPILLVESCNGVHPATLAEISRLAPQQVVALGGTTAICDETLAAAGS